MCPITFISQIFCQSSVVTSKKPGTPPIPAFEQNISIPPAIFDSVITMPSVDFQKVCRDMHNLADNIEIKSLEIQLIFRRNSKMIQRKS